MTDSGHTAQEVLRADILEVGEDDFVSMADVQACLSGGKLADLSAGQQRLVVDTVRSLLADGLVEVGALPGPNDPGFNPWPGTVDDVMARFVERFIGRHDDPRQWQFSIWLNLTAKGREALSAVEDT